MNKYLQLCSLFLLLIFIVSCKGQQKIDEPKDNIKQSEIKLPDFDSYFMESKAITTSSGPTNITRNIVQDRNGNFWFATWEGIIGYDGQFFTNFSNKEGLRRFRAFSVLEDKAGNIWFGTIGAGVYRYDGKSFTNFTTKDGLVNDDVGCIYEDKKGNIWFGTRVGVSCYDGNSFRNFTTKDGLADNDINGIIEDNDGKFWFAARGEACYYDGETFTKVTRDEGIPFINARSIIKDKKGNIWLGGNDGLWCYDGKSFTNFTTNFIGNISEDSKGNIWVSRSDPDNIYNMSLYCYDGKVLPSKLAKSTQIIKENGQVFGIIEDTNGNIWFGNERGVCRYDGKTFDYFK